MTRLTIGGIAAGTFTLGLLAGLVLPGTLVFARHDERMAARPPVIGSMPMMNMGSMSMAAMPMMDMGSMPMMDTGSMPMSPNSAGHQTHHASPEAGR